MYKLNTCIMDENRGNLTDLEKLYGILSLLHYNTGQKELIINLLKSYLTNKPYNFDNIFANHIREYA